MRQPIICVLDEITANKIAAGEVVERPASVIKELVENSLDAGSRRIEVEITEGGLDYIRVTDNGSGMSPADAQLAVLRHATSKIRVAEDLYRITTLGFRGEALPSIASVSRFSLTTRLNEEPLATYIEIHGGNMIETREAGAGVGTTVVVRDLFYNTPARRKFLKTAATEGNYIHAIIGKLALANPGVAFILINNGRQVLNTPGNGDLLSAMASLYGNKLLNEVLPIEFQDTTLAIYGYVAKPTFLKSSRQWQTFLVNSRVVNSRIAAKALDSAYHSLLPKNGYPLAVLRIDVPPDSVDVNVHPQKNEVKFSDEQRIYRAVYKAVSDALKKPESPIKTAASMADAETIHYGYPPAAMSSSALTKQPELWRETKSAMAFYSFTEARAALEQADFSHAAATLSAASNASPAPLYELPEPPAHILQPLGQIEECYIIAGGNDGLYIIDQHAAHERILYDRLAGATGNIPVQQLLVPIFVEFDLQEIAVIEDSIEFLGMLGFAVDIAGPTTIRLSAVPADISLSEAEPMIRDCLQIIQDTKHPSSQTLRHAFLQIAACRSAIKAGDRLNMRQMQALLDELMRTDLPYTCPHGRPAIIRFGRSDLEKMFKRT
ncbi:MAG: DNA mismatch repair endonuclease MutL [Negativicutes bacterium]|nr:DNA mismatch repair endonuclease MutL [Negativicutes bacterium]